MEFNTTFIVAAISFIVFVFIMNAIFYKPLQKIVDNRQKFIDDHHNDAASAHDKSDSLLNEKEQKMDITKLEAKRIIIDKSETAKKKKAYMSSEAQMVASTTIDGAKQDLKKSKEHAQDVLSMEVVNLAQNISFKILGESVPIESTDRTVIDRIMQG